METSLYDELPGFVLERQVLLAGGAGSLSGALVKSKPLAS